jgi:aminobenzoyl-glutamate utilization protein B
MGKIARDLPQAQKRNSYYSSQIFCLLWLGNKMKKQHLCMCLFLGLFVIQPSLNWGQVQHPDLKKAAIEHIDTISGSLIEVSDAIWECAEIALLEFRSARILADAAEKAGFTVKMGVADLPTAFVASFGSGRPIIGILAEYDALPGLSQDFTPYPKVLVEGEAGHGCGHNLFGAGSLGAALALKEILNAHKIDGTVRLYGCPAEEDVGGKMYMAREGLFDDLDVCLAWHPDQSTKVDTRGSQAIDDLKIEFFGKTSHAAFDPWKGLSALDGLEMTTFGVNLLREHIKPTVRIHYVITGGGKVPNVVPDYAELWLWVRDSKRQGVKDVIGRIEKIVEGAALATGTQAKIHNLGSYHEMLVNMIGSAAMQKNLEWIGPIEYTQDEAAFARRIQKEAGVEEKGMDITIKELETQAKDPDGGSTDVAEVSWVVPTLHVSIVTAPSGVPWHSWAVVAASKHSIGHKGMLQAAKVLALTSLDFLMDEKLRQASQQEFKQKLGGYTYTSGIPRDKKPPVRTKK